LPLSIRPPVLDRDHHGSARARRWASAAASGRGSVRWLRCGRS